jgi:hypothetical protein
MAILTDDFHVRFVEDYNTATLPHEKYYVRSLAILTRPRS